MKDKIISREEDTTGVYDDLFHACLSFYGQACEEIGEAHGLNESQVLTGLISVFCGFVNTGYGPESLADVLEKIKTSMIKTNSEKAH